MKFKVFIDGNKGTTGLRINERFQGREDIELLVIPEELRHDNETIKKYINESDITFLCLPDDASKEHATFLDPSNKHTKIIDASTAHRVDPNLAYGFPELSADHFNAIKKNQLVAGPGCYASGFLSIAYPLVKLGVANPDYPFAANAISGYSGACKKGIAQYEDKERSVEFDAPRLYAMSEAHKHMKEMMFIPGLKEKPLFVPYVCDFYEGMIVNIPLYVSKLNKKVTPKELHDMFEQYYKGSAFVKVMPFNEKGTEDGFLSANSIAGKDYLCIYVSGNDERILLTALLDNLGKGASGAAIECMNIALGLDSTKGLNL
jgi:N-acetyl-gamma-glutamyl-phosphate reductase